MAELGLESGSPGLEFIAFPNSEKQIVRRNKRERDRPEVPLENLRSSGPVISKQVRYSSKISYLYSIFLGGGGNVLILPYMILYPLCYNE